VRSSMPPLHLRLSGTLRLTTLLLIVACAEDSTMPAAAPDHFTQQGPKLVGTGSVGAAWQGMAVALSADGSTAIVGGPYDNGVGVPLDNGVGGVWVWTRSGGVWTQQGPKLVGIDTEGSAYQGNSVSLSDDGNTAVVGGPQDDSNTGAAWVWVRSGGVWTQQGPKLIGAGAVGAAFQGSSVSLSGDGNTAIVGGSGDNGYVGAAWIWTRSGGVWSQQGSKVVGTGAVDSSWQGSSVSLSSDGSTAIVGGIYDNGGTGAAWVWTRSGGVWTQQGPKLVGAGAVDSGLQGFSVSISGDGNTAIVGAPLDNSSAGAAWIWTRTGGTWTQQGSKLVAAGVGGAGESVSLSNDGSRAIVGSPGDNSAWVWTRSGGVWSQLESNLVGTGEASPARQGTAVSLSGDGTTAIIGGPWDDPDGAAWIFTLH